MEVKMINNCPVKIWTDNVEESAMRQIENLTTLPFLFHHLAIMCGYWLWNVCSKDELEGRRYSN